LIFPPHPCLTPPSGGTPCNINVTYTALKSIHLIGYNSAVDNGSIFIRLAVVGCQICETPREFVVIVGQDHSRSSILLSMERALCNFLLYSHTLDVSPTVFEILTFKT